MALTDPISITINGSAKSLARVSVDGRKSTYQTNDGEWRLVVSTQEGRRRRTLVQLVHTTTATDPYDTNRMVPVESVLNYTFNHELLFTGELANLVHAFTGLNSWLAASSNAALTKVVAGES